MINAIVFDFLFPSTSRVTAFNMYRLDAKIGEIRGLRPSFLSGALPGKWHSSASSGAQAISYGKVSITVEGRRRQ